MNMNEYHKLTQNWLNFEQFKQQFQKVPVDEYPNTVLRDIPRPKISVRITTYQHVNYIRDTLDHVLAQKTHFPYEIVLGDDDSNDGTREICKKYAAKYPDKIRFFQHKRENNIKVLGRPTGIFQIGYNTMQCRGKYIAGCSGDDYWQDEFKLQKQIDFMEKNQEVSFTYHDHKKLLTTRGEFSGPFATTRTQTIVGKNIFDRLPAEFFNITQEDSFFKFCWKECGRAAYIPDIEPAIIRWHPKSMYSNLSREIKFEQKKNLWHNMIAVFADNSSIKKRAKKRFVKVIYYYYKNNSKLSPLLKISCILREIRKQGFTLQGLYYLSYLGLRKIKKAFQLY